MKKRSTKRRLIANLNFIANNYKDKIWLVSCGRSGSTWVADLLNFHLQYRLMLEPFHDDIVRGMEFVKPFKYIGSNDEVGIFEKTAGRVFNGKLYNWRVDSENKGVQYKGLLIKDVYANLFAYWASTKFIDEKKIVFLIRNPFAVALSIAKKQNWHWMKCPLYFLDQPNLCTDYLSPYINQIKEIHAKNDPFLNQMLIWAIVHYVPFRQFNLENINTVFYEDIYLNTNEEIAKLLSNLQSDKKDDHGSIPENVIKKRSRFTSFKSTIHKGVDHLTSWQNEISDEQMLIGKEILAWFKLDTMYDDQSIPYKGILQNFNK